MEAGGLSLDATPLTFDRTIPLSAVRGAKARHVVVL
jgi:hypothetical protein